MYPVAWRIVIVRSKEDDRGLFYHFFPVILYSKKAEIFSVDSTGVYSKVDGTGIRDMPVGIG